MLPMPCHTAHEHLQHEKSSLCVAGLLNICNVSRGQARCAQPPRRHSTTTRRSARNMPTVTQLLSLRFLWLVVAVAANPAPGRVPKVYNALITSNQNLEPSKAYPVYQPVLHETYAFPFQPSVYFGEFPLSNGIQPVPGLPPKQPNESPTPAPAPQQPTEKPTELPPAASEPSEQPQSASTTSAPPLPPSTESPIPLNEFGLPPQVIPLGRIDPAYEGFSQVGPLTYTYPSFRLYDPFDPFSLSPFAQLPSLYRPLPSIIRQSAPILVNKQTIPTAAPPTRIEQSADSPPPEPIDLNLLNYSSKDPSIPDVPPPPLPQGNLKSEKSE
ncbi:uncharacterized protein LOC113518383 [Galleria mellonella]|uniref:Uncharacterized protein LOC113518383 n=1 Tax=Galleria mellonella TaxID=7137 RepID=A0A6J1X0U9_GALME|nr:uncharacterized protein LOC113518383 [Galleria mellonella]